MLNKEELFTPRFELDLSFKSWLLWFIDGKDSLNKEDIELIRKQANDYQRFLRSMFL